MQVDGNGLEILSRAECLTLMASTPVGRIVFTDRALPAIQPVNFLLDSDDSVIVRTAGSSKLATATRDTIVAFETDDSDAAAGTGWSVTILGPATAVTDPAAVAKLAQLPLRPWGPGRNDHYIRIAGRHITGRRIIATSGQIGRPPDASALLTGYSDILVHGRPLPGDDLPEGRS